MKPKDSRNKLWSVFEKDIQKRARNKDKSFKIYGKWKKFVRTQDGLKVFSVDGKWIRNNLCCYFGHGGHGLVHEFIPMNEVWISTHHYHEGYSGINSCNCKVRKRNQQVSRAYFESTTIHEIEEFMQMKKGKPYWQAHNIALEKERKSGLLKDPFDDR